MDVATAQKKLEELRQRRQRKDYWQATEGKNYIRILPNWDGEIGGDWYRETAYHRKLGPSRDKSVVCLAQEKHEKCPVCDMWRELYKTKNPEDIALAREIKAQKRVLYNIIDLKQQEKGVQLWASGVDVFEQLMSFCANPKYGDISDPIEGRNVELSFTKAEHSKTKFNDYLVQPDPDKTPLEDEKWLENLIDLDSLVKPISYEEIEALLTGESAPSKVEPPKVVEPVKELQKAAVSVEPEKVEPAKEIQAASKIQSVLEKLKAARAEKS